VTKLRCVSIDEIDKELMLIVSEKSKIVKLDRKIRYKKGNKR